MTQEEQKAVEEFTEMNLTKKGLYHYNDMQDAFLIGLFKGEKMQPSLPSNLDEAAEKYSENILANNEDLQDAIEDAFKAGAEWYDNQMKMPNSSELISAWRGVKSILQEKDFRGDEWRLAYNAFMFGFSKGLNTRTKKK